LGITDVRHCQCITVPKSILCWWKPIPALDSHASISYLQINDYTQFELVFSREYHVLESNQYKVLFGSHCKISSRESMRETGKSGNISGKPAYSKCFTQPEPHCGCCPIAPHWRFVFRSWGSTLITQMSELDWVTLHDSPFRVQLQMVLHQFTFYEQHPHAVHKKMKISSLFSLALWM
jgi:hypothetical protein